MKLEKIVNGMNLKEVLLRHLCEAYIEGKHQRTFFSKDEATRASKILELVHSDVCEPLKTWWNTIVCLLHRQHFEKNSCLPFESERKGV